MSGGGHFFHRPMFAFSALFFILVLYPWALAFSLEIFSGSRKGFVIYRTFQKSSRIQNPFIVRDTRFHSCFCICALCRRTAFAYP